MAIIDVRYDPAVYTPERNVGAYGDGTSGLQACVFVGVATGFAVGFAGIELYIRLPHDRGRISNSSVHASVTGGRQWYFFVFVISIKIVCWKCVFLTPIFFGTFLFFKHPLEEIKRENLGSRF